MPDSPSWLGRGGRGRWQPGWRGGFRGRVVPVAPPCLPELFFLFFFFMKKKKKSFSSHPKLPGRTQPGQWEPPRSAQPMEPAGRVRPVGPPRKDKLWGSWGDTGTPTSQHPLCPKRPRCQQEIGEGRQLGEGVRPRCAARPPLNLAKWLRASVFPSGEWAQGWGVTPAVPRGVTASPVPRR